MSGGSLDYAYQKVNELAVLLKQKHFTPLQRAFGEHLTKVSQALHDIEFVLSGDYKDGADEKAIKEVLGPESNNKALEILMHDVKQVIAEVEKLIEKPGK